MVSFGSGKVCSRPKSDKQLTAIYGNLLFVNVTHKSSISFQVLLTL